MRKSIKKTDPIEKFEEHSKDELIKTLEAKVKLLTDEISVLKQSVSLQNPENDIIQTELKRLHVDVVSNGMSLDKEDLKKFDTLVKCLVALKGGTEDKKTKSKKKESPEALLRRVMSA